MDKKEIDSLIKLNPFFIIDKNLTKYKKISISLIKTDDSSLNREIIKSELNSTIYREMTNCLFDSNNYGFLDLRNYTNTIDRSKKIQDFLSYESYDFNNFATSKAIAQEIASNPSFAPSTFDGSMKSELFYNFGSFSHIIGHVIKDMILPNKHVYKISLFNEVRLNINDVNIDDPTLGSRIIFDFKYSLEIGDSKVIYLINDENSEKYSEFKSYSREEKINIILD